MKTIMIEGSYKGHPTVSIHEADAAGNPLGKPIVTMGFRKLCALFSKQEEIKSWLKQRIQPEIEGLDI